MRFKTGLESRKFTLEVTMPHKIEFVDAVIKGGAQALKTRCNDGGSSVLHNGIKIGVFQEMKPFFAEVIAHAGEIPVGLVPGTPDSFITAEEVDEAARMGFDYFNCAPEFARPHIYTGGKIHNVAAVTAENMTAAQLKGIDLDPNVDIVEGNVVTREEMDKPLVYNDILLYRALVSSVHQPVIATGQRICRPEDVKLFYDAGCKAYMLGVVAFLAFQEERGGGPLTPETCAILTEKFREAIEKL